MLMENNMLNKASSTTGKREYESQVPRTSPANAPNAAPPMGPNKPPPKSQGMAENTINAEPGFAGIPGTGRAEADVIFNSINKFTMGIKMKKAIKIPHSR